MRIYIEVSTDPYDPATPAVKAAYISSPFEAKDDIRGLPVRRWDPARKRWVIPATDIDITHARLTAAGYTVEIVGRKGREQPEPGRRTTTRTWADDMFEQLPERFHGGVHGALSKILHPDIGGDVQAMQALNIARDRAKGAA